MFKNVYSAHREHKKLTNAGEKCRPNYKPVYKENGAYELEECGVIHSYEDTQAWAPTCDMASIMERYIRTGDDALLNRRAGFYGDVTDLPKDYATLHNLMKNADDIFMSLPVEVREAFGHNPAVFYADNDKANDVISKYISSKVNVAPVVENNVPPVVDNGLVKEGVVNE